jgi:hypothetical protein
VFRRCSSHDRAGAPAHERAAVYRRVACALNVPGPVSQLNGFNGAVSLSLGGVTATQARWSFTPANVTGGAGSSQLKITSLASLATGRYRLR